MKVWLLMGLLCCFLVGCTDGYKEVYRQNILNLAWSPDRKQLAFVYANFNTIEHGGLLVSYPTLWLIDSDGKNLRKIPLDKNRLVEKIVQWHNEDEILMVGNQEFYSVDVNKNTTKTLFELSSLGRVGANYCFKNNKIIARRFSDENITENSEDFSAILDLETQTITNLTTVHDNLTPSQIIISSCDPHSNKVFFSNNKTPHDGTEMIYGIGELNYETGELSQIQWVDKYTATHERRERLIPLGWLKPEVLLYQKWDHDSGRGLSPLLEFNTQIGVSKESSKFTLAGAYFPFTYSPDMSQVAFVDGNELVIAKSDGSQRKVLMNFVNILPKGMPQLVWLNNRRLEC